MIRDLGHSVIRDVGRLIEEGTSAGSSDEQLLSRFTAARDRSSAAFEAIVRRHGPMVLETCLRLLDGDPYAAEDAFQATFLVLARRADAIIAHPSGSLGPWLHEVACRTARKARVARIRREKRELRASRRPDATVVTSGNAVDDADDHRILHEEVSRLPEKHRAAIVLCYFEGLTHEQAAASLRWPVGTVRGYLARARDLLRTRLVRRGVAPALAIGLMEGRATSALPPLLIETVVRVTAQLSAGSTAVSLGGAIARRLAISRSKRSLLALVLLALGAGGAGLVASQFRLPPAIQAVPSAENTRQRERLDVHGDPLPDGAVARLGTSRFNHGTNIIGMAYTPDGKGLLTFGYDGFVKVWDPSTGRLIRSLIPDGSGGSRQFALSDDGRRLFTVEQSHEAHFRLWDFETGRELRRVPVPNPKPYLSLAAYSPDGKTVAVLLADNSIAFRDGETLAEVRRMKRVSGYVRQITFSPDGRLLAGTNEDRAHHIRLHGGAGQAAPVTPEAAEKSSIVAWDVAKAAESWRTEVDGCHPDSLVFSPDGRILAAAFCDGSIRFYDSSAGREQGRMKAEGPGQHALAFSRDGKTLASADDTAGTAGIKIPRSARSPPARPCGGCGRSRSWIRSTLPRRGGSCNASRRDSRGHARPAMPAPRSGGRALDGHSGFVGILVMSDSLSMVTGVSVESGHDGENVPRDLILTCELSPGDIVMMTAAVRDLHLAHPGRFRTDVRTSASAIWEHNPFITPLDEADPSVSTIAMHYDLIHQSNEGAYHFIHGYARHLEQVLGLRIPLTTFRGDLHLSDEEKSWMSQVEEDAIGWRGDFWIIVAGGKYDYTAKWWDPARFQRVVDHFRGRIQFVQCGEEGHWHPRLDGVIDLVGKTDLRQFIRLMYHAAGVVSPVTFAMHLAAAVEVKPGRAKNRACVVVAGGREPSQWEKYGHHRFLETNGALPCCDQGGCWKSRCQTLGDGDAKESADQLCILPVQVAPDLRIPRCMDLIGADDVIRAIELYHRGGSYRYLDHAGD